MGHGERRTGSRLKAKVVGTIIVMCLMLYIVADQGIAEHTRGAVTIQAIDDKVAANLALVSRSRTGAW